MREDEVWFDAEYSETWLAWGHLTPEQFVKGARRHNVEVDAGFEEEDLPNLEYTRNSLKHIYAVPDKADEGKPKEHWERFWFCEPNTEGAQPVTRLLP